VVPEGLESFYSQKVEWYDCGGFDLRLLQFFLLGFQLFELLGGDSALLPARLGGLLQCLSFSCGSLLLYLSVHLLGYAGEHLVCGCVCGGRGHDLGRRTFGEDDRAVGFTFFDLPFGVFTRGCLFELEGFDSSIFESLLELADGCFRSRDGDG